MLGLPDHSRIDRSIPKWHITCRIARVLYRIVCGLLALAILAGILLIGPMVFALIVALPKGDKAAVAAFALLPVALMAWLWHEAMEDGGDCGRPCASCGAPLDPKSRAVYCSPQCRHYAALERSKREALARDIAGYGECPF